MHILVAGFQHETIPSRRPRPATTTSSVAGFPPWCAARAMLALWQVNILAGGFINAVVAQATVRP